LQARNFLTRFPNAEKEESPVVETVKAIKVGRSVEDDVIAAADGSCDGFRNKDEIQNKSRGGHIPEFKEMRFVTDDRDEV
jgi:hypothetical protein